MVLAGKDVSISRLTMRYKPIHYAIPKDRNDWGKRFILKDSKKNFVEVGRWSPGRQGFIVERDDFCPSSIVFDLCAPIEESNPSWTPL